MATATETTTATVTITASTLPVVYATNTIRASACKRVEMSTQKNNVSSVPPVNANSSDNQIERLWSQAYSIQTKLTAASQQQYPQKTLPLPQSFALSAPSPQSFLTSPLRIQLQHTLSDILICCIDTALVKHQIKYLREAVGSRNICDLTWNLGFRQNIEALRSTIALAQKTVSSKDLQLSTTQLISFIDTASIFYRTLIHNISVHVDKCASFDLAETSVNLYTGNRDWLAIGSIRAAVSARDCEEIAKLLQRVLFSSAVFLGDLERYRAIYSLDPNIKGKWMNSIAMYEYAISIDFDQGGVSHEISTSSMHAPQIAKDNLATFHERVTCRLPQQQSAENLELLSLDSLSTSIIHFHQRYLFHPSDSKLLSWNSETYAAAVSLQSVIYTLFEKFISTGVQRDDEIELEKLDTADADAIVDLVLKTIVILISAYADLGAIFVEKDKSPQIRQRIRDIQVLVISLMFRIAASCFTRLELSQLDGTTTNDSFTALFAPMGILCAWINTTFPMISTDSGISLEPASAALPPKTMQMDIFTLFSKYTSNNANDMKLQNASLSIFSRALAPLATALLAYADVEGSRTALPEDLGGLLAFSPMKQFYLGLDARSLKRWAAGAHRGDFRVGGDDGSVSNVVARASRVLALARRMGERKELEIFGFDEKEIKFVVRDEESKRLARLQTSRALAFQLLKTQVEDLELTHIPQLTPITYIPDAGVYTRHLSLVKTILIATAGTNKNPSNKPQQQQSSSSPHILVPTDTIHDLDVLKRDSPRAREATRFLEQRFRFTSDRLAAQQTGETLATPFETAALSDYSTIMPRRGVRGFVACAAYARARGVEAARARIAGFEKGRAESGEDDFYALDHGRVWVLSEDPEVLEECRRCGVAVRSVAEVEKEFFRGRKWR
ncbi:hypothetical protein HK100_008106 [Physocladia obscura]|uniref:Telomerase activating protein Est1-like N-terminal domain-containing protein n=1 Tax=Physocladia obscura TaxID=109957 RepID=A0AAD5XMI3_9FUNG|nr:hypothetical protein HK100_008106 [Physocladia obscura]